MSEEQSWLTMREVAKILGVSYPTIARMVQQGKIPAVKVGRQYRISPEQVKRFIAVNTTAPPIKVVGEEQ